MIAITGATGQLGHYVIESLMKTVPASQIVAIVRNPAKAQARPGSTRHYRASG